MSKSPLKPKDIEKMVRADAKVDILPEGKVVYSLCEKESNSGLFNNERFLILNCKESQLFYFDSIPKMPIPVTNLNDIPKPKPKNSVAFKDVKFERPKEGLKNRLKFTLPNDEKGKPRTWLFIMSSKMVDTWFRELEHFRDYPLDQSAPINNLNNPTQQLAPSSKIQPLKNPQQPKVLQPEPQLPKPNNNSSYIAPVQPVQQPQLQPQPVQQPPQQAGQPSIITSYPPLTQSSPSNPPSKIQEAPSRYLPPPQSPYNQQRSNIASATPKVQPSNPNPIDTNRSVPSQSYYNAPETQQIVRQDTGLKYRPPLVDTPMSQPRRNVFPNEPPETLRSDEYYVRQENPNPNTYQPPLEPSKVHDPWTDPKPQQQSFPYRVADPKAYKQPSSMFGSSLPPPPASANLVSGSYAAPPTSQAQHPEQQRRPDYNIQPEPVFNSKPPPSPFQPENARSSIVQHQSNIPEPLKPYSHLAPVQAPPAVQSPAVTSSQLQPTNQMQYSQPRPAEPEQIKSPQFRASDAPGLQPSQFRRLVQPPEYVPADATRSTQLRTEQHPLQGSSQFRPLQSHQPPSQFRPNQNNTQSSQLRDQKLRPLAAASQPRDNPLKLEAQHQFQSANMEVRSQVPNIYGAGAPFASYQQNPGVAANPPFTSPGSQPEIISPNFSQVNVEQPRGQPRGYGDPSPSNGNIQDLRFTPSSQNPNQNQRQQNQISSQIPANRAMGPENRQQKKKELIDWNHEFNLANADQLAVLRDFRNQAEQSTRIVVDDFTAKPRQFQPYSHTKFSEIYLHNGFILKFAFYEPLQTKQGITLKDNHIQTLVCEFNNYNYILNSTKNHTHIKVPLTCLTEYKGISCLVKAEIKSAAEVQPVEIQGELIKLERLTKIHKSVFTNGFSTVFRQSSNSPYIYIDDLITFLPLDVWQGGRQFRHQAIEVSNTFLTGEPINTSDQMKLDRATHKALADLQLVSENIKDNCLALVSNVEQLLVTVINWKDIKREMHKNWISSQYLPIMFENSEVPLFKQYFASEMAAKVAQGLMRNHMYNRIDELRIKNIKMKQSQCQAFLLEEAREFLNDLVANTSDSNNLWRNILTEVYNHYQVNIARDDIAVGFFLSSIFDKSNLKLNYKNLSTQCQFFKDRTCIDKLFVEGFNVKSRMYSFGYLQTFRKVIEIVQEEPSEEGLDTLMELLDLRQQKLSEDNPKFDELCLYIGNFIPPDMLQEMEFAHLGLYTNMLAQPPTNFSIRLSLMAAKWAIKMKKEQTAFDLFEKTSDLIVFWGGEFHPLLSEFFDFFAQVYMSSSDYDEAINLAKSSLVNTIKIVGADGLPASEKFFQLGNCYFKAGKKQEALTNYLKTKDVLASNKRTHTREFGVVLLKLAILELNFGKISQAIDYGLDCLGIFEREQNNQKELVESLEVLARAYEINQMSDRINELATLCSERLKNCEDPKIFERMLKITMYPQLSSLPQSSVKNLLNIVEDLSANRTPASYSKAFNYIYRRAQEENVSEVLVAYFEKADRLAIDISQKDLLRKHKGFDVEARTEAQDFLVLLDAVLGLIDDSYVIGILREYEY